MVKLIQTAAWGFHLEDPPIDLEFPVDLQGLPLGVIVGAGKADVARFRLNRLHQPAARASLQRRNRNFTSEARRMRHEFSLADA